MKIVLPMCPSLNSAYGGGSGQRRFKSKKYTSWLASCPRLNPLKLKRAKIVYRFWFKDNRASDLSNRIKLCEDFLVSQGVIEDDNWKVIYEFSAIAMGIDRKNPRVEIEIL